MPDMDEIARMLGISKTTVHRALHQTGRINESTRERVLEAARQIGYRPNQIARSLRTQRTNTLGVVVTSVAGAFYGKMLGGIESAAQNDHYGILLTCSHRDPEKERALVEMLLDKQVDGLIIAPSDPSLNAEFYRGLVKQRRRLVFIDRAMPGVDVVCVATDNVRGGVLAANHLLDAGRRHVAFLTPPSTQRLYSSVQGRLEGCNQALRERGLGPAQVLGPETSDTSPIPQFGYETLKHHVLAGSRIDGLFAASDDLAIGAIAALIEAGIRVPEDVSVVGFGDEGMGAYVRPALTTIQAPLHSIGETAVNLLFHRLQMGTEADLSQQALLEPTLIVRKS